MTQTIAAFDEALRDFEAGEYAEDAVVTAARGHRVGVGSDDDRLQVRIGSGEPADEVAGGIDRRLKPTGAELVGEPFPPLQEEGREGAARPRAVGIGDPRQGLDAPPEAIGVDGSQPLRRRAEEAAVAGVVADRRSIPGECAADISRRHADGELTALEGTPLDGGEALRRIEQEAAGL